MINAAHDTMNDEDLNELRTGGRGGKTQETKINNESIKHRRKHVSSKTAKCRGSGSPSNIEKGAK